MEAGDRRILVERFELEQVRLEQASELLDTDRIQELVGPGVITALQQLISKQLAVVESFTGDSEDTDWGRLARTTRASDHVLGECLAVIAGSLTCSVPTFATLCEEARCVAAELSRLTLVASHFDIIPAEVECAGVASSVVRRRFPDHGIWDLPVVAHEFGHLVARDLLDVDPISGDTSRPLADFLAGRKAQSAELAADVFAVFSVGPSYVLSLVLHRMNPFAPADADDKASHPGDASRVEAALHALRLLGDSEKRPERKTQYDFIIDTVRDWWDEAQTSATDEARLSEDSGARVRNETDKIWALLIASQFVNVRYQSFFEARALANALGKGDRPASTSARDVLNAAWITRLRAWRDGENVPTITTEWARAELRLMADKPEGGTQ